MMWALLNDFFQRLITFNKVEQRRMLLRQIGLLRQVSGAQVLDFGCGTGLFATVFQKAGYRYWGYDIDERLLKYARILYPWAGFTRSVAQLREAGPFDLIIANCCFHHIDDESLKVELERINGLLSNSGLFIMKDLLRVQKDESKLHRAFMKLEQGRYVRGLEAYQRIVSAVFSIFKIEVERSHVLSLRHCMNPFYNDLAVFVCRKPERLAACVS